MYKTGLSRITFWFLVSLTAISHFWVALGQLPASLVKGSEGNFLAKALEDHPAILRSILLECLPLSLPYFLFFWLVAWLARPREPARRWTESPTFFVIASWLGLSWLVLRVHALMFPNSLWAWLMLSVTTRDTVYALDALAALWILWRVANLMKQASARESRRFGFKHAASGLVLVALTFFCSRYFAPSAVTPVPGQASNQYPNVIVIGIDALRRDVLMTASSNELPNIASVRDQSFVQTNVVTPLARTYGAWSSILTGKHPTENGVRENHAPLAVSNLSGSFAAVMQRAGYRTIYATDETRFSAIDKGFGFDQVVGPTPGVADFLIGQFADIPLVNMVIQLPFMERLAPTLTGNRAFAHAYRPSRFVQRVRHEIGPVTHQPTLLAMHLCTAHHPFITAAEKKWKSLDEAYFVALRAVDQQLGAMLKMLRGAGYLNEKSLLVLLSDHGEGLALDQDVPPKLRQHDTTLNSPPLMRGHGGSLLEDAQWKVFAAFGGSSVNGRIEPGRSDQLLSLQDLAPAILTLAGIEAETDFPLAVTQAKGGLITDAPSRPYVLMETGFRPRGFNLEAPDAGAAIDIAKTTYNILDNGRLELRDYAYSRALVEKDLGVTDGDQLLAVLWGDDEQAMIAVDYAQNTWDVYPDAHIETEFPPPLLNEACSEGEFRARIKGWCDGLVQGDSGGAERSQSRRVNRGDKQR